MIQFNFSTKDDQTIRIGYRSYRLWASLTIIQWTAFATGKLRRRISIAQLYLRTDY